MIKNLKSLLLINLIVFLGLFIFLEGGARIFLYFLRGSSTVGMPERTLYLSYRPFVMFGQDWDTTLNPKQYPLLKEGTHVHRVLLLGGSTAAFFPTKILEKAFQQKFPHHQFEVINAAEGGYIARQEAVVAALWAPALQPEIIITLDGANDLTHRLRMEKAGTFFLDDAYDLALKKPFLSPLAHLLRYSQLTQGIQRLGERIHLSSYEKYADAIPVYIATQHAINVLAKGLEATRIMVLQPFMSFKTPLSAEEASFKNYKYREAVIMKLYDLENEKMNVLASEDHVIYIDGRSAYNGMSNTIFSDDVHFVNDDGYQRLADQIVKPLNEKILKGD